MARRVVITGLGAVTSLGHDVATFWNACMAGESRVETIPEAWRQYADYQSNVWSPLSPIDYDSRGLQRMDLLQKDPVATMALLAASEALADAGLETNEAEGRQRPIVGLDPNRVGVSMGTGLGGTDSIVSTLTGHLLAGPRRIIDDLAEEVRDQLADLTAALGAATRVSPLAVAMIMANSAASAISIKFAITGPASTYTSACAAGTVAIGQGYEGIRSGKLDAVIAGGSESMVDAYGAAFRSFDGARTLASGDLEPSQINRPFDQRRSGFLFSEGGAAVLLLEEFEHAAARNANMIAEVAGFAETSDAHNPVATDPDGLQIERAFRDALSSAGLAPSAVDYVNAHGTGTVLNDEVESAMLDRVVGDRAAINSTKSLIGHTLGASGAIEAVVAALSIRDQATHASLNIADPIRDLDFVREPGPRPIAVAVSESFAFGGHNAALVLKSID